MEEYNNLDSSIEQGADDDAFFDKTSNSIDVQLASLEHEVDAIDKPYIDDLTNFEADYLKEELHFDDSDAYIDGSLDIQDELIEDTLDNYEDSLDDSLDNDDDYNDDYDD